MGKIPNIIIGQKPTYIKFDQDIDFFGLFQKIEKEFATCFILESLGDEGKFSRFAIIGFKPEDVISAKGKEIVVKGKTYTVENPYKTVQEIMPQHAIARNYAGGLVGYLSYEAINFFEPSLSVKVHELFPQFEFGVYTDGLVLDKVTNEVYYFFYEHDRSSQIKQLMQKKAPIGKVSVTYTGDSLSKEKHAKTVAYVKEEIRKGNTFQCEVGFKSEFRITGDTLAIYKKLREVNPSPFMYFMKFGERKIIGASPELLFGLRDREMESFPLAGTIRRGKDDVEDKQLARELLQDPKEIAEHNMLVDLHRNDLGRVATFGTVKVRRVFDIKRFSHVQHISSEVVGIMRNGEDMFSGLAATMPAGTLSGAPKIESMKIIDRLEKEARGPYGGALGHFGFNGNCTFAIPIRTLFIAGEYAYTQTSGGIVYDSNPDSEYDEIQRKMAAMRKALGVEV